MTHEDTVTDETLVRDIEKASDAKSAGTSVPHEDDAELEPRLRESLEASVQMDEALASVRRDTYQQIAEAKRIGEPDRRIMEIARAGRRRSVELLTLDAPFPDPPTAIALLATQDLPISELAKMWTTSSERIFGPPYADGGAGGYGYEIATASKTTGNFHVKCLTQDEGGIFYAGASFRLDFGLVIPTNPLLAGLPVSGTSVRQGRTRILPTFSGLGEAYMVAASHMTAKSSCQIAMSVSDGRSNGFSASLIREYLWNEQSSTPPGTQIQRWSQTRTFTSPWFPVDSEQRYSVYINLTVKADGEPDGDNSYAEALAEIAGRLSSIRVSQYLTD